MGVLDIIDTNRVELSKPGVQVAIKEVRLLMRDEKAHQ